MNTNKTNGRPEFTREIRGFTFGTPVKNLFLLPALMAVLNLIPAGRVTAQTFTTLHSFMAAFGYDYTNSDGAYPRAGLILTNNILYGTASGGGAGGAGTVFAVNTDGAGFTNLHSFSEAGLVAYVYTNGDGAYPYAGLILSCTTL